MPDQYQATDRRIAPPEGAGWWIERIGTNAWVGHTPRGSSVVMAAAEAGIENSFSPGDLLKLALAGCAGMSSEGPVTRRLGEDHAATIAVAGQAHETEDRYVSFDENVLLDMVALDDGQRAGLLSAMMRSIQVGCTIGLTLQGDVTITTQLTDAPSTA